MAAAAAAAVRREIEEIKTLADRSIAYASLLQLQRRSADDPASMEALALYSPPLLPLILSDAHRPDEEIAAQALKCLGFMIYHPSLVIAITESDAGMVLDSLVKLITTVRMKALCNLGVWCISIQQFSADFIKGHARSVLGAVVYALDNPFGSLSTTFEGIQAVIKLADQLCDIMRELSNIWVPPIYRRLISKDKRERNMTERCILKTKSIIFPPPPTLSEFAEKDLKRNLLPRMMNLLQDHGQKVHLIQAWGWYISLLGSNTLNNRHLVNTLLKIPEKMFTDCDPQVQIASLFAWERFIDAILPAQAVELETMIAQGCGFQQSAPTSSMRHCGNKLSSLSKRIKVIMVPLLGLLSSKCDISVHSSCLNTWQYLLHKLDLSVNHPSIITISFMPILKVIFLRGPDRRSICVWTSCLDLLDEFVLSKVKDENMSSTTENSHCKFDKTSDTGLHVDSKTSSKHYPVKWLPWEISNLNIFIQMIHDIINQESLINLAPENRIMACNAASRIFRSVLQGVQVEFKTPSTHHDRIRFCIDNLLKFIGGLCDSMSSKQVTNHCSDFIWMILQFVKSIRDELEPSILASPLYQVRLDLIYINTQSPENIESLKARGLGTTALPGMNMVSPIVFTTILYLCVVAQSIVYLAEIDGLPRAMEHSKFLIFSANPSINFDAVICFLYMHVGIPVHKRLHWLTVWRVIAKGLKETIDSVNELAFLKTEYGDTGYTMIHWFLCYPLLMLFSPENFSEPQSVGGCSELSMVSLQRDLELELVNEVWKSLFDSSSYVAQSVHSSRNSFTEGLCKIFNDVVDDNITKLHGGIESCLKEDFQNTIPLFVLGEATIHLLKHIQILDFTSESAVINHEHGNCEPCSPIKHVLGLVARFLGMLLSCMEANPQADHVVISRVFASVACLVGRICFKQDIVFLTEMISNPIVGWLSFCASEYGTMQQGSIIHQLQRIWAQILECLQRSYPPIDFDSLFLGIQAPLLQATLVHPHPPISDASIAFWKATYGKKTNLLYPQCLHLVLDMLSRNGRISIQEESPVFVLNNHNSVKKVTDVSQRYIVPKPIGSSIMGKHQDDNECVDIISMGVKRKRFRMAKQPITTSIAHRGKLLDVSGSDPRETVDFSGVLTNPPENQELRKTEYILGMLRRAS